MLSRAILALCLVSAASVDETLSSEQNGLILATDDGYCTLQCYDPDTTKTDRFVVKTTAGGKTWWEVPLVSDAAVRPFGVAFVDEDRGWVGAAAGP